VPKFKGKISRFQLKGRKYTKTLEQAIEVQVRQGAREFVRAAVPLIPVLTGMARGTLQPLGRFLRVAVPIRPTARRSGRGAEAGAFRSSFEFKQVGKAFIFTFGHNVEHFRINDIVSNPFTASAPWQALEAGERAFLKYMETIAVKRLPLAHEASFFIDTGLDL